MNVNMFCCFFELRLRVLYTATSGGLWDSMRPA